MSYALCTHRLSLYHSRDTNHDDKVTSLSFVPPVFFPYRKPHVNWNSIGCQIGRSVSNYRSSSVMIPLVATVVALEIDGFYCTPMYMQMEFGHTRWKCVWHAIYYSAFVLWALHRMNCHTVHVPSASIRHSSYHTVQVLKRNTQGPEHEHIHIWLCHAVTPTGILVRQYHMTYAYQVCGQVLRTCTCI